MAGFLIDASAVWRMWREVGVRSRWAGVVEDGDVRSCEAMRAEIRRSARRRSELELYDDQFATSFPDAPMPKAAWRWVSTAQYRLAERGAARSLSVVDLLVCAAAIHHDLTIVHDDHDFETAVRFLPDGVRAHRVGQPPQ